MSRVSSAPAVRVRDVVVCATGSTDVPVDEARLHPPIASKFPLNTRGDSSPVSLGRSVSIDRLSKEENELVMNACTPRGHYFSPIRQFGQRYSFIREVDLGMFEHDRRRWDPDDALWDALVLSRLVRDNCCSTRYAARIVDYEDGEQMVVYSLVSESKHVYRLRSGRDWLDPEEGLTLRDLLAAYRVCRDELPARVRRAMWRCEYVCWLQWADLAIAILSSGLESLLQTEQNGVTKQFKTRVPALAEELGVDGVTTQLCDDMYDARSAWIHGAHVRLSAGDPEADQAHNTGPTTPIERDALAGAALLQDVLRATVRRCITDADFRAVFADDNSIRDRWPL